MSDTLDKQTDAIAKILVEYKATLVEGDQLDPVMATLVNTYLDVQKKNEYGKAYVKSLFASIFLGFFFAPFWILAVIMFFLARANTNSINRILEEARIYVKSQPHLNAQYEANCAALLVIP